jgi:hypothetical protein
MASSSLVNREFLVVEQPWFVLDSVLAILGFISFCVFADSRSA